MTEKRNPKEVTLSFLVICFGRNQPIESVRGRQDGEDKREKKKRNKEMLKVHQLVSVWNYTISHHTDKDRKKNLPNLDQRISRHQEVKYYRKFSSMQAAR